MDPKVRCTNSELNHQHNPTPWDFIENILLCLSTIKLATRQGNKASVNLYQFISYKKTVAMLNVEFSSAATHANCEHSKPMYSLEGRLNNSINHATEHRNFLFKKIKN